jgi:hypothetical protein
VAVDVYDREISNHLAPILQKNNSDPRASQSGTTSTSASVQPSPPPGASPAVLPPTSTSSALTLRMAPWHHTRHCSRDLSGAPKTLNFPSAHAANAAQIAVLSKLFHPYTSLSTSVHYYLLRFGRLERKCRGASVSRLARARYPLLPPALLPLRAICLLGGSLCRPSPQGARGEDCGKFSLVTQRYRQTGRVGRLLRKAQLEELPATCC